MKQTIKILQWNTLADCFCNQQSFPLINSDYLRWEHRALQLHQHIQQNEADIYCFQEVDQPGFFKTLLRDYQFIYQRKMANNDGILIAYKNHLKLQEVLIIPFLDNNEVSNQFFIKVKFQNFTLITTHLKAKIQFEHIRTEQLQQISKYLSDDKIVLCGDFNTQPELEAVTKFIDITKFKNCNNLLPTTSKNRGKLETNIKDYIFYKGIQLQSIQIGPKEQIEFKEEGLPNEQFPSDHLYLLGEFEL